MKIEYIYTPKKDEQQDAEIIFRQIEKENTIGCLITSLVMLCLLFIFIALLPVFLTILGYLIIVLACITIYKAYLEQFVLNFIQKHNLRRKKN